MQRPVKQSLIGLVFLAIIVLLFLGLRLLSTPIVTCFDNIQNQNEAGVDCGGICAKLCTPSLAPLKIKDTWLINAGSTAAGMSYDVLFLVTNSNPSFGSGSTVYQLNLYDQTGVVVSAQSGDFYILPGQTKYVYFALPTIKTIATRAEVKILSADWQLASNDFSQNLRLVVKNYDYHLSTQPGRAAELSGTMRNDSDLALEQVDLVVVLFENGVPVAANQTGVRTSSPKQDNGFLVFWQTPPVSGTPERVDIEVGTNIFQDANFIRRYGQPEKFQQFYP